MDVTPSSSYMPRHDQNGEEEGWGNYILILVGNKFHGVRSGAYREQRQHMYVKGTIPKMKLLLRCAQASGNQGF